jgi:SAM-dependent methyltransferase
MQCCIELAQSLPSGWKRILSKSGRPYFFNADKKITQWHEPEPETPLCLPCPLPFMDTNTLDTRTVHQSLLLWLKHLTCSELGQFSSMRTVVDMGCGNGEASLELAKQAHEYHGWDKNQKTLDTFQSQFKKTTADYLSSSTTIFEAFDFCSEGHDLPASAPRERCDFIVCMDAVQYAFANAASARRWARRVRMLLDKNGFAVLLLPNAIEIVDKTANGCTEWIYRQRMSLTTHGAHWPVSILEQPVYGARYSLNTSSCGPLFWPNDATPISNLPCLVSFPTLNHACVSARLKIDAYFPSSMFLNWCGMNHEAAKSPIAKERRDRASKSFEKNISCVFGDVCASDWEGLQLWCFVIISRDDAYVREWKF